MSKREQPELLTVAYIAIGAETTLRGAESTISQENLDQTIECYGGELGVIDEAVSHALMLDTVADGLDHNCVFSYDVAEEFGARLVARSLAVYSPLESPIDVLRDTLLDADYDRDDVLSGIEAWRARK